MLKPNRWLLVALFVGGGGSAFLALILNHSVEKYTLLWGESPDVLHATLFWVLGVGVNEEFSKMLVLVALVYFRRDFVNPYQGLVYAATVALGFAAVENVFYLERFGTVTLLIRSVLTIPAHAFFTIPMGILLFYSRAAATPGQKYFWMMSGLIVSASFHGVYDIFMTMDSDALSSLAYLQVGLMGFLAYRLARMAPRSSPKRALRDFPG